MNVTRNKTKFTLEMPVEEWKIVYKCLKSLSNYHNALTMNNGLKKMLECAEQGTFFVVGLMMDFTFPNNYMQALKKALNLGLEDLDHACNMWETRAKNKFIAYSQINVLNIERLVIHELLSKLKEIK